ncbi:MAG TPA: hypothetical protein VLW50_22340 [Streptosporangiaceae bacterium]|nr:hypothetical protein [Streptosporangiaceae bacterium]
MSTTEIKGEIPLEEIQRTLSEALGHAYRVTATSDSTLKIRRMPLITAEVKVGWHDDGTALRAAPGEAWILQGINALTIYPKLRRTLAQAFPPAPDGHANTGQASPS